MVCAHGGDDEHFPPNTRGAFEAALAEGAPCMEVRLTGTVALNLAGLRIGLSACILTCHRLRVRLTSLARRMESLSCCTAGNWQP